MGIVVLLAFFGIGLMGAGGWSMLIGFDAVLVERSWAQMVGGSIMLAAGAVILAMALALIEVVRTRRAVAELVSATADAAAEARSRAVVSVAAPAARRPRPMSEPAAEDDTASPAAVPPRQVRAVDRALGVSPPAPRAAEAPLRSVDEATEEVERALSSVIASGVVVPKRAAGARAVAASPDIEEPAPADSTSAGPEPVAPRQEARAVSPKMEPPKPVADVSDVTAAPDIDRLLADPLRTGAAKAADPRATTILSIPPNVPSIPAGEFAMGPPPAPAMPVDLKPRSPADMAADLLPVQNDLMRLLAPGPALPPAMPPSRPVDPTPPAPVPVAEEEPVIPVPAPPSPPVAETAPPPPQPPTVPEKRPDIVRSFVIGQNTYTIYADGSIAAATPDGPRTFASFEEMRQFIDRQSPSPKRSLAAE